MKKKIDSILFVVYNLNFGGVGLSTERAFSSPSAGATFFEVLLLATLATPLHSSATTKNIPNSFMLL